MNRRAFFQLVHEPSDILLTCTGTWVCMGLDGSTCSESLPEGTCYFEPPGHVSRTSVRAQTYAVGSGRTPCVPRSREHEKDPRPEEKKMSKCQKTHLYVVIQGSPSGCVRREIPGLTQVDEKGHEGNTAVVTAYLCWRKYGQRNSRTGVPADYHYLLRTLYTRTATLLSTTRCYLL